MIYVLVGIIGLLVIILVAMGIMLWQDKDYVYTREEFHERIKNIKENKDKVINSLQNKIKENQHFFHTSYDFLNNLIDEERGNSFKFESKYNIGDNIWYVKDNKTYQGKIKTITTELFKTKNNIEAAPYIYLLECDANTKESEIICGH